MTSSDITNTTDDITQPAVGTSITPAATTPESASTPVATKTPAPVKTARKTVRRAPVKKMTSAPASTPAPAVAAKKSAAKSTPAAAAKVVAKPLAKAPQKTPAKAKAATQAPIKSTAQASADKATKLKKPKLVRDSFTIPKSEFAVLDELKQRSINLAQPAKKSELLRAGIKALAAMSDAALKSVLAAVPTIKTGRPSKN